MTYVCTERGLFVSNTYFEHRQFHKYISGGKEHDRSGGGEESYAVLCAGYEGSNRYYHI